MFFKLIYDDMTLYFNLEWHSSTLCGNSARRISNKASTKCWATCPNLARLWMMISVVYSLVTTWTQTTKPMTRLQISKHLLAPWSSQFFLFIFFLVQFFFFFLYFWWGRGQEGNGVGWLIKSFVHNHQNIFCKLFGANVAYYIHFGTCLHLVLHAWIHPCCITPQN